MVYKYLSFNSIDESIGWIDALLNEFDWTMNIKVPFWGNYVPLTDQRDMYDGDFR